MRQMGDYAFMLRDWKLAQSTYEFLRTDFSHDKAWTYQAAANEMAALTSLLFSQALNSKSRAESVDQMLETAAYSYLTRCTMPMNVVRCLTLATELLKSQNPVTIDAAVRWGGRLLELGISAPLIQSLMSERLADCYASAAVSASSRKRHAAFWNVLASDSWMRLDKSILSNHRLELAKEVYETGNRANGGLPFASMQTLWEWLGRPSQSAGKDETYALLHLENELDSYSDTRPKSEQLNHCSEMDAVSFSPQLRGHHMTTDFQDAGLVSDGFE